MKTDTVGVYIPNKRIIHINCCISFFSDLFHCFLSSNQSCPKWLISLFKFQNSHGVTVF